MSLRGYIFLNHHVNRRLPHGNRIAPRTPQLVSEARIVATDTTNDLAFLMSDVEFNNGSSVSGLEKIVEVV